MDIQYFKTAWNDIKHSPGWMSKIFLLALVGLVPIFGQIVQFGYLYGWARDIAWGVHQPMPARIFENADGKLYRRGFFALVITIIVAIVPFVLMSIADALLGAGVYATYDSSSMAVATSTVSTGSTVAGFLIMIAALFTSLIVVVVGPICCTRMAIYDRLSAGLQAGKITKMIAHDKKGVARILGMYLLVGLIVSIVFCVIAFTLFALLALLMLFTVGSTSITDATYESMSVTALVFASGGSILVSLICVYFASIAETYLAMLTARAAGYWMYQFDVPHWTGQDDPMPFER